jgi:hypothetical protein
MALRPDPAGPDAGLGAAAAQGQELTASKTGLRAWHHQPGLREPSNAHKRRAGRTLVAVRHGQQRWWYVAKGERMVKRTAKSDPSLMVQPRRKPWPISSVLPRSLNSRISREGQWHSAISAAGRWSSSVGQRGERAARSCRSGSSSFVSILTSRRRCWPSRSTSRDRSACGRSWTRWT